jgi:hypothetical protein
MGIKKSSGVITMKYTYRIVKTINTKSGPYLQIQEIDSKGFFMTWSVGELFDNSKTELDYVQIVYNSFYRTKKWVLRNHPELLL